MTPRKRHHPRVYRAILERQEFKCARCGEKLAGAAEFDHICPIGLGGEDKPDNIQALCLPCHRAKTTMPMTGDRAKIAKADRIREKHLGIRKSARKRAMAKMMGFESGKEP